MSGILNKRSGRRNSIIKISDPPLQVVGFMDYVKKKLRMHKSKIHNICTKEASFLKKELIGCMELINKNQRHYSTNKHLISSYLLQIDKLPIDEMTSSINAECDLDTSGDLFSCDLIKVSQKQHSESFDILTNIEANELGNHFLTPLTNLNESIITTNEPRLTSEERKLLNNEKMYFVDAYDGDVNNLLLDFNNQISQTNLSAGTKNCETAHIDLKYLNNKIKVTQVTTYIPIDENICNNQILVPDKDPSRMNSTVVKEFQSNENEITNDFAAKKYNTTNVPNQLLPPVHQVCCNESIIYDGADETFLVSHNTSNIDKKSNVSTSTQTDEKNCNNEVRNLNVSNRRVGSDDFARFLIKLEKLSTSENYDKDLKKLFDEEVMPKYKLLQNILLKAVDDYDLAKYQKEQQKKKVNKNRKNRFNPFIYHSDRDLVDTNELDVKEFSSKSNEPNMNEMKNQHLEQFGHLLTFSDSSDSELDDPPDWRKV